MHSSLGEGSGFTGAELEGSEETGHPAQLCDFMKKGLSSLDPFCPTADKILIFFWPLIVTI